MSRSAQAQDSDPRTYAIIGAAMDVHRRLGCGFLESVYTEALAIELSEHGVPFRREADLPVFYRDRKLSASYRADFICYDEVVVEVKALARLGGVEEAQAINYLKAGRFAAGLLINFGARSLESRRYALTAPADNPQITLIPPIQDGHQPESLSSPEQSVSSSAKSAADSPPVPGSSRSSPQSTSSAESADNSSSSPSADNPSSERGDA